MTYDYPFDPDRKTEDRLIKGVGCAILGYILAFFAVWAVIIFVAAHFILKAW